MLSRREDTHGHGHTRARPDSSSSSASLSPPSDTGATPSGSGSGSGDATTGDGGDSGSGSGSTGDGDGGDSGSGSGSGSTGDGGDRWQPRRRLENGETNVSTAGNNVQTAAHTHTHTRNGQAAAAVATATAAGVVATAAAAAAATTGKTAQSGTQPRKRTRCLRDTDRRNIIKRIENGEKQAALAREFGVTRAAICHIKKNRFEIMTRYEELIRTANEMEKSENYGCPSPGEMVTVHEVRSRSVLLLMTSLRDSRSDSAEFRRVTTRLVTILLEEAISSLEMQAIRISTPSGTQTNGLVTGPSFCGVAMGSDGVPFLMRFNQMEPDAPCGTIDVETIMDRYGNYISFVERVDLPADVALHQIVLFTATCSSGAETCKAIEALCSAGAAEGNITVVMILCATEGLVAICDQFPHVKIITAAIDGEMDRHTQSVIPGLGDFVARYNGMDFTM